MLAQVHIGARGLLFVAMLLAGGCASLPEDVYRPVSVAYTDTGSTSLGRARQVEKQAHPGQSGFRILDNGLDAFVARGVLAQRAERSIDAQYYLLHDDDTGALFVDQLIDAADRGVRVRLLVDDMDIVGRDIGAAILDDHPNMEVRLFNPFSRQGSKVVQLVTRFGAVTRRMHNKSFTVDNQVAILGGRNIGDEYFGANPELDYSDLDVMAIGPVVDEVSESFDSYWNSEIVYPAKSLAGDLPQPGEIQERYSAFRQAVAELEDSPYMQALRNSDLANEVRQSRVDFVWGYAEIVSDDPEKVVAGRNATGYHLATQLRPYFTDVSDELIIITPYFVPARSGTRFLTELAQSGVRVRILTNSLASNDVPIVHSAYAQYRKELLRSDVELYEVSNVLSKEQRDYRSGFSRSGSASLHAKSFVFDRRKVFVGSLNLDPRSIVENTEIGMVLNSREIAGDLSGWFEDYVLENAFEVELIENANGTERLVWHGVENGEQVTYGFDPYTSFPQRLGNSLAGLLPIESQL